MSSESEDKQEALTQPLYAAAAGVGMRALGSPIVWWENRNPKWGSICRRGEGRLGDGGGLCFAWFQKILQKNLLRFGAFRWSNLTPHRQQQRRLVFCVAECHEPETFKEIAEIGTL